MFCWKCGAPHTEGAAFCTQCGAPSNPVPNSPTATTVVQVTEYAGFWRRFVAHFIDGMLLGFVGLIIVFFWILINLGSIMMLSDPDELGDAAMQFVGSLILLGILHSVIQWLYYALMESSKHQGTLGKLALNLVVTDYDGQRISFGRATGRYFAKILSGMIMCIGYIMVAFTAKKQGLHDMIASTYVKKRREVTVIPS